MRKALKKILLFACILEIFSVNIISVHANWYETLPKLESENSISKLEKLDIVRKPFERWKQEDGITRRDMFKMAYIIKNGNREFYENNTNSEEAITYIENWKEKNSWRQTEYMDVEPASFDYYLTYSLLRTRLISGEHGENGYVANFDSYGTYEQALTIIGRLFDDPDIYGNFYLENELVDKQKEHPYYIFACNIGLINSSNPMNVASPQITIEQLNQPITAYEYMDLLYRALYIPFVRVKDYEVSVNAHYIDYYWLLPMENDTIHEDIID